VSCALIVLFINFLKIRDINEFEPLSRAPTSGKLVLEPSVIMDSSDAEAGHFHEPRSIGNLNFVQVRNHGFPPNY